MLKILEHAEAPIFFDFCQNYVLLLKRLAERVLSGKVALFFHGHERLLAFRVAQYVVTAFVGASRVFTDPDRGSRDGFAQLVSDETIEHPGPEIAGEGFHPFTGHALRRPNFR